MRGTLVTLSASLSLWLAAEPTGFEPAISTVTVWHVGPLHHGSLFGAIENALWHSSCAQ